MTNITGSNHGSIALSLVVCMYVCILRARVQPTLDPYAEAFFYSRPIALTQEGRSLVNDVCKCVHD